MARIVFAKELSLDFGGRWEPDPRDPQRRERWREGDRWTRHIRDRGR